MTIPNLLTSVRIVLLPLALYFFYQNNLQANLLSLVLVVLFELSDLLDGFLARKLNKVSNIGKIFDPFADHIYRLSFFLFFYIKGFYPLWMFLICFYRDSLVLNLRLFAIVYKHDVVAARGSGKIKAEIQSLAIITFILLQIINYRSPIAGLANIYYLGMFVVAVVTLWSAFDYFFGVMEKRVRYFHVVYYLSALLALYLFIRIHHIF